MGIILQIAIGICLIIVTGGLVNYLNSHSKRIKKNGISSNRAEQFEDRLNNLEKRLTDIQDVMLSIDDKLARLEKTQHPDG